jgi:hypothetical protein
MGRRFDCSHCDYRLYVLRTAVCAMREPSKLPVVSPDTSALGAAKQHVTRTATGPSVSPRTISVAAPSPKRAPSGGYADVGGDRWQALSKAR